MFYHAFITQIVLRTCDMMVTYQPLSLCSRV